MRRTLVFAIRRAFFNVIRMDNFAKKNGAMMKLGTFFLVADFSCGVAGGGVVKQRRRI